MSKQQEDLQSVVEFTEKRKRAMTQKALEYTVESKQRNARSLEEKIRRITRSIEALDPNPVPATCCVSLQPQRRNLT